MRNVKVIEIFRTKKGLFIVTDYKTFQFNETEIKLIKKAIKNDTQKN